VQYRFFIADDSLECKWPLSLCLGNFYNFPDEKKGWIDFFLNKRTQTLIDMGYGKFAKTAGILEDKDEL